MDVYLPTSASNCLMLDKLSADTLYPLAVAKFKDYLFREVTQSGYVATLVEYGVDDSGELVVFYGLPFGGGGYAHTVMWYSSKWDMLSETWYPRHVDPSRPDVVDITVTQAQVEYIEMSATITESGVVTDRNE